MLRPSEGRREIVIGLLVVKTDPCTELLRMSIFPGGSDMVRTRFIGVLVLFLVAFHIAPPGTLWAQVPATAGHEHLTEVACVDVPPGEKRPEFGCFNVGTVTGLHFSETSVYWHLRAFPDRKAAEAARSATGIVVEEDGRAWLSEFGARNSAPQGGEPIAVVGPMQLPTAKSYSAVLSYAVMRPGDSSRVHTHPGPEGWYVLAGEQCLETPAGADRARAGGTMTVRSNIPMELNVTGNTLRRAFALVIHDSTQQRGTPSDWKPSGACSR
jgi:quercetin dioxygenase-like cupin family protein